MTVEEFDQATPAQLLALIDQYREDEKQKDYRSGLLASLLVNTSARDDKEVPVRWLDFFAQHQPEGYKGYEFRKALKEQANAIIAKATVQAQGKRKLRN